jgi:hypothetical protein
MTSRHSYIRINALADIIKRWTLKLAQEKAGNTLEIISAAINSKCNSNVSLLRGMIGR